MRRFYDTKTFLNIVENVRKKVSDFNFTTDIIVGFPGETEEDFQRTIDISKQIQFGHIHTFKYSVRKGTRAERMNDHIPEKIKTERSEIIRRLAEELKMDYRKQFVGNNQRVLVEKLKNGIASGYGEHYIPVAFDAKEIKKNEFYNIGITSIEKGEEPILLSGL